MLNYLKPNIKFLLYCSKIDKIEYEKNYIIEYIKDIKDIESILKLSTKQAVFPHIAKNLDRYFPSINFYRLSHIKYNMKLSSELINIVNFLEKKEIRTLSFKGSTLAKNAYGDIGLRQFADIDILIYKSDRFRVYDYMVKKRYIPEIELTESNKKSFFNSVNVLGFYHPVSKVYIEIHWELLSKNYAIQWNEKKIWQNSSKVTINHTDITTMNLEQQLLYLSIHGGKHLFERIGWICDIDRTLRISSKIDWRLLLDEAEEMGTKRMLFIALYISHKLLSTPLTSDIQHKIDKNRVVKKITKKIISLQFGSKKIKYKAFKKFIILYGMRENQIDRVNFIYHSLFSPKFDDFKTIKLPNFLWFLYPIIRPIRLLVKYIR